jgi:predicted DNA-binding antitoxin AbrB/MazE fold protein
MKGKGMVIHAIYENGIIKPIEEVNLKNNQKITLYYWEDMENENDLEQAYKEASIYNEDLSDWNSIETEDWPE